MKLVLLGVPGSGKGSHSSYLKNLYGVPHISTGDIFRTAMSQQTPLGLLAKSYIDEGNLVPDDITIKLVNERLTQPDCKRGFILDGYPRTLIQAKELSKLVKIDGVLYFNLSLKESLRRLLARRICSKCGKIFNLSIYSKNKCDNCGGQLYTRDDDNVDTITKRFTVYNQLTSPLIDYYKQRGILYELDVNYSFEENKDNILKVVKGL